jgi:hypothetical protein
MHSSSPKGDKDDPRTDRTVGRDPWPGERDARAVAIARISRAQHGHRLLVGANPAISVAIVKDGNVSIAERVEHDRACATRVQLKPVGSIEVHKGQPALIPV